MLRHTALADKPISVRLEECTPAGAAWASRSWTTRVSDGIGLLDTGFCGPVCDDVPPDSELPGCVLAGAVDRCRDAAFTLLRRSLADGPVEGLSDWSIRALLVFADAFGGALRNAYCLGPAGDWAGSLEGK